MKDIDIDIYLLEKGTWQRCLYCRRVLPTQEHVSNLLKQEMSGFTKETITVDESGYCKDCQKILK